MDRAINKVYLIILSLVILVMSVLFFALPDKTYSQAENRNLYTAPDFNIDTLSSGEFTEDFGLYIADQFPFRDSFVAVKAYFELLQGKSENNGVVYGKNGTLIPRIDISEDRLQENIATIAEFATRNNLSLTLAALPRSIDVFSEFLPANYPVNNDAIVWDNLRSFAKSYNIKTVDLYDTLCESNAYYRTDHHYTTKGAFLTYSLLGAKLGYNPLSEDEFWLEKVTDEFCGTSMRSSGFYFAQKDSINLYRYDGDTKYNVIADGQEIELYDRSKLNVTDKYAVFLGGNHSLVKISEQGKKKEKLLIIRDSFADSLVPFLAIHFDITMVDLRYYGENVSKLVKDEKIENVLVLQNVSELISSRNLSRLKMQ